ncbi:hypothetical protein [Providencia sneebia]|uniref:Topoisomerase IV subunit A subunit n=1 Tax=Providencia sneebia DSM 19967 TaxID=1141660 RepID=K8W5W1_9GAMM|nr:hypothetical protein [Providencia sneebia]EKT55983.1 hypothetical protein OO7_13479 [Providencia sneebia DSM 19967]
MSSRKTAIVVVLIFIAFALVFSWLGKDNNSLSVQTESDATPIVSIDPLTPAQAKILANLEKKLPILITIKQISPETFQSIELAIHTYDPSNEKLTRQMYDQITGSSMKLVLERMPYASDDAVINFTLKMNEYLSNLLESDPSGKSCFYSLFPDLRDSTDMTLPEKNSENLVERLDATNELLISSESGIQQSILPIEEQTAILKDIQQKVIKEYGNSVLLLGDLDKAKLQPALTCQTMIYFYGQALEIPDNQQKAAFLRTLFSSSNNTNT